jgi:Zn-dependent protease with chaperone function
VKSVVIAAGLVAGLIAVALGARAARARDGGPAGAQPDDGATTGAGAPSASASAGAGAGAASSAAEPEGPADAPVNVPAPSEKALRYYRSGNVIWAVDQILGLGLPALLLFTGLSARLRTFAASIGRGHMYPTLVITFALLSVLLFLIQLPMSYYVGYAREHAYGLSTQLFGKWAADQLKGLAVGLLVGAAVLWVPYLLLARSPGRWWVWTGALSLPFFALVLLVTPVFIAPLFNKFGPMKDKALESQILAEAARAGVDGARVYEVDKSVDTEKVNAYVTGVGSTKRIVLWDTLLKRLSPRQTRFVVGHEIGHYVLGHVVISIFVSSALVLLGLWGVHRTADGLLGRFGAQFGFDRLADPASIPLFMLLLSFFSLLVTPASLALSRHQEHEADRFGLELTHDNHAAATAFVALQRQNLANPRPGWLFKVFRASHPPIGERVDFINEYRPWERGEPGRYDDRIRK